MMRINSAALAFGKLEGLLCLSLVALFAQLGWPSLVEWAERPRPGLQGVIRLSSAVQNSGSEAASIAPRCLLYLPRAYASDDRRWPLLLFLHGSGARGDDPALVRSGGLPKVVERGRPLPAIVLSPQCQRTFDWEPAAVLNVIQQVQDRYRVDPDRISVCGYSMGAFGAWETAAAEPERFAALLTIAGGADAALANRLIDLPIWALHGDQDETVPIESSEEIVKAVRQAGGSPRFDVLQGQGHAIQMQVLSRPEVLSWLLEQSRRRPSPVPGMPPS